MRVSHYVRIGFKSVKTLKVYPFYHQGRGELDQNVGGGVQITKLKPLPLHVELHFSQSGQTRQTISLSMT